MKVLKKVKESLEDLRRIYEAEGFKHIISHLPKKFDESDFQFYIYPVLKSKFPTSKEHYSGDGLIDFFIYSDPKKPILIELKLSTNQHYLDGVALQLPEYLQRENTPYGFFLFIYVPTVLTFPQMKQKILDEISKIPEKLKIEPIFIDLTLRPSPSHLTRTMGTKKSSKKKPRRR